MPDLPINIEDLLRQRTVEGERIEYKAGWNPTAIMRTLCAFANDFENLGGGYLIIGQDCDENGQPVFPPVGLNDNQLDPIQQQLLAFCNQIQPPYFPILSVEEYEGRKLIVLWAPGGQNRPYKAPRDVKAKNKEYHYFIRRYSSTVQVVENSEDQRELLSLTATIPFDDRQCPTARVDDLKLPLIKEYLKEVGSNLADAGNLSLLELCRQMNIVDGGDEFVTPRNVGLLFFNDEPTKFLSGSQIDVVIFPKGPGGGELIEKSFRGPIHEQVRSALRYIQNEVIRERVIKQRDRAEAIRLFNYPFPAIEEALVNAVYHRSYEQQEPVEVRISPDRIEIVSYPGPDASIRIEALNGERIVARRYRNRRIGDFLKELDLTEGRCTGIPTIRAAMAENGSPPPRFATDETRTYFFAELLVHPDLPGIGTAKDETHVEAYVELTEDESALLDFIAVEPKSRAEIAAQLGVSPRGRAVNRVLGGLLSGALVEMTIPDKPSSRNQKYRATDTGKKHGKML